MTPLQKVRDQRKYSQRQVSEITGIDQAVLSRIENSERSRSQPDRPGATPAQAAILAKHFGHAVTEAEILYPSDYLVQQEATEAA